MTYTSLRVEHDGRIGRIVFNRPERMNALTAKAPLEFPQAIEELTLDKDVRVIIWKGDGRTFSAGFDKNVNQDEVGWHSIIEEALGSREWIDGLLQIWSCPKPVIAQLHGYAVGFGGLPLLFCDLRYSSDEFKVFMAAGNTGSFLGEVWAWFIGLTAAKEFTFRPNNRLTAQELYNFGLLNRIYPLADLEQQVEAIAAEISRTDPVFLRMQKIGLNRHWEINGFRERIHATKDIDLMLHWSPLGQANYEALKAFGGDRRKMAQAQLQDPDYWKKLKPPPA